MFDLELLDQAKERVRSRVEERTWSAYVETAERMAEAGRGRSRARHEGRRGLPGQAQRDHTVAAGDRDSPRSLLR